ncbi:hypothetical protein C8Q76DRAFT_451349 [Earliella scabrosa]|nr:hypothetical protein C8Q76DRAFT_451349 [Earliella scabrosa]
MGLLALRRHPRPCLSALVCLLLDRSSPDRSRPHPDGCSGVNAGRQVDCRCRTPSLRLRCCIASPGATRALHTISESVGASKFACRSEQERTTGKVRTSRPPRARRLHALAHGMSTRLALPASPHVWFPGIAHPVLTHAR